MMLALLLVSLLVAASVPSPIQVEDANIRCFDQKEEDNNSTCVAESISEKPWSTNMSEPAPAPDSLNVEWYTTMTSEGQNIIMVNITWSQKRMKIMKTVEGYYAEIKSHNMMSMPGYQRRFHLNFNQTNFDGVDMMWFSYDGCCSSHNPPLGGKLKGDIMPGDIISVSLHALPLYHLQSLAKRDRVIIPDCYSDERIQATENCARSRDYTTVIPCPPCPQIRTIPQYEDMAEKSEDDSYDAYPVDAVYFGDYPEDCFCPPPSEKVTNLATSSTTYAIGIVVGGIVVVLLAFVLITVRAKQHTTSSDDKTAPCGGSGGIVILVPTFGVEGRPPVWELTQTLATYLHKNSPDDVTCNLWHLTTPAPDKWLSDVIAGHRSRELQSHVLMVRSGGNHSSGTDAYQIFDEKLKKFHSHSVIHFGDDATTTTSSYRLPRDVTKLMFELTNGSCTADDVIISELEKLATKVEMTSQQQQV